MIEKGLKPEEIVKCINNTDENITKQDDFSDDSEEEIEVKKKSKVKQDGNDTESDIEIERIKEKAEEDNIISIDSLESIEKLKKYIEKNQNNLLKRGKEAGHKINNNNNHYQENHNINEQGQHFLHKKRRGPDS